MGGKNPTLLFADADLERARPGIAVVSAGHRDKIESYVALARTAPQAVPVHAQIRTATLTFGSKIPDTAGSRTIGVRK